MNRIASHGRSPMVDVLRTYVLPIAIVLGGIIGFVALGGRRAIEPRPEEVAKAPLVQTVPVTRHQGKLDLSVDGLVVPSHEINLAAEIAGRIVKKDPTCRAGNYVAKGAVLFEIDPRDYDLEAERLQKELDQAKVSLDELNVEEENTQRLRELAKETLVLQHNEVERLEKLAGREKAYVTQSQLDQERRNELAARNALLTLENQLRSIQTRRHRLESVRDLVTVRLKEAKLRCDRTKITMPVDGVIVRDLVEQDAYVGPGTLVAVVEDTSTVEVRCNLQMDELYWLWNQRAAPQGKPASREARADYQIPQTPVTVVYTLAGRNYAWDGVLSRYEGIGLDEATRTVSCRVVVKDPRAVRRLDKPGGVASPASGGPPALVRGMYVTIDIHATPTTELLQIPERAVRPGNEVWRVRDGRLRVMPLHLVSMMNDTAVVRSVSNDLVPGDRIVVTPLALVEDGMEVREEGTR